jgi:hypothetical protein
MSSDNEREIRSRLGGMLDTITPAPAPVSAVIARGRGVRRRRRAAVAAGLAVVIGLGAALPGILRLGSPSPVASARSQVTVSPPGRGAAPGLIATGTVNGRHWQAKLQGSGGTAYVAISGIAPIQQVTGVTAADADPASLSVIGSPPNTALVGAVRADITELTVQLPGGTVLDLHPVAWHGRRWVAIVFPSRPGITSIAAYGRRGEVAYAVPFNHDEPVGWLKPGDRGPARATITFGSGVAGGQAWSAIARVGPWGRCLEGGPARVCGAGLSSLVSQGQLAEQMACGPFTAGTTFYLGAAAPDVRSVRLHLSDGSSIRVRPVTVGQSRNFAFTVGQGLRLTRWTAYNASGQQLGAGRGWSCPGS